jgi:hypothetical protein
MSTIPSGWPLFLLFWGLVLYGIWRFIEFVRRTNDTVARTGRDVAEIKALLQDQEQNQPRGN